MSAPRLTDDRYLDPGLATRAMRRLHRAILCRCRVMSSCTKQSRPVGPSPTTWYGRFQCSALRLRPSSSPLRSAKGTVELPRIIAAVLSLVITTLSITLTARHRQAELSDAEWLENYESSVIGSDRPVHGLTFMRSVMVGP